MAYTPINWQTGDTITAEKLNRCDNGWGVESTQLFSETVTTASSEYGYSAVLSYAATINAPVLAVTFDGTEYTCPRIDMFDSYSYGGMGESGPDFTDYPFLITPMGGNVLFTETAGTHTVTASAEGVEVSDNFRAAVGSCVDTSTMPMLCVSGITTYNEMLSAMEARRLLYFYAGFTMHIITYFLEAESETAVQALPAGTENIETYGFEDMDGTLVFQVFIY